MDTQTNGNANGTSGAEDIFREDLFPEEEGEILNTMDVTRKLYAIRMIEKQIARYELQDQESRSFYADKQAKGEQRIDFIKQGLLAFLKQNDLQNVQTPAGTAYRRVVTTKHWPDEDVLLAWATAYLPAAVRTNREPDKKLIGEHIRTTGEIPDGYSLTVETRLYVK